MRLTCRSQLKRGPKLPDSNLETILMSTHLQDMLFSLFQEGRMRERKEMKQVGDYRRIFWSWAVLLLFLETFLTFFFLPFEPFVVF